MAFKHETQSHEHGRLKPRRMLLAGVKVTSTLLTSTEVLFSHPIVVSSGLNVSIQEDHDILDAELIWTDGGEFPDAPVCKKWEYMTVTSEGLAQPTVADGLRVFGDLGWELCSTVTTSGIVVFYYFKREVPDVSRS